LGATTLFVQGFLGSYLFGEDWESAWVWWLVFVPVYVIVFIYFTRFLGTFLLRQWTRDIVQAQFTHQAIGDLLAGILAEPKVTNTLAASMQQGALVEAAAILVASVVRSSEVQAAAAETVAHCLRSQLVIEALGDSIEALLKTPGFPRGLEALGNDERLLEPLIAQVSRLLQDDRFVESVAYFLQETLERGEVKDVLKMRCKSIVGDAELYKAGMSGMRGTVGLPAVSVPGPTGLLQKLSANITSRMYSSGAAADLSPPLLSRESKNDLKLSI